MVGVNMLNESGGKWTSVPKRKENKKPQDGTKDAKTNNKTKQTVLGKSNVYNNMLKAGGQSSETIKSTFAALDALSKKTAEPLPQDSDSDTEIMENTMSEVKAPEPLKKEVKKEKATKVKKVKVTMAQVAGTLDNASLTEPLRLIEARYPDNPPAQLARVADYFEKIFKGVELPFNKLLQELPLAKAFEVPVNDLSAAQIRLITAWIAGRPAADASKFALELVYTVVESCPGKGNSKTKASAAKSAVGPPGAGAPGTRLSAGLLLVLALTLRAHPDCLLIHHAQLQGSRFAGEERTRLLVWLLGQTSLSSSPGAAIALWTRVFLPQLPSLSSRSLVLDLALGLVEDLAERCARSSLTKTQVMKRASRVGGPEAMLPIPALAAFLHLAFTHTEPGVAARLRNVYCELRVLALAPGGRSGRSAQLLLQSTLDQARTTKPGSDFFGALEMNLLWSLAADPATTLPQLRDIYPKQLTLLSSFLPCLLRAWSKQPSSSSAFPAVWGGAPQPPPREQLRAVIQAIRGVHARELAGAPAKEGAALRAADAVARNLERKLQPTSVVKTTIKIMGVATVIGAVSVAAAGYTLEDCMALLSAGNIEKLHSQAAKYLSEGQDMVMLHAEQLKSWIIAKNLERRQGGSL